ncbi:MAG: hypothetical protein HY749_16005 [Gammaproteobacteria bacterium]|nr:hypothetical protein [Gammaproteobacteria bacterium]
MSSTPISRESVETAFYLGITLGHLHETGGPELDNILLRLKLEHESYETLLQIRDLETEAAP